VGIFSRRAATPTIDIEALTTAVANKVVEMLPPPAAAPIEATSTELVEKMAGMLPAPTAVLPDVQTASASPGGTITVQPLPRNDFGGGWAFGPGIPLIPSAIDPREPATGRPAPRRSEFPSSVNLQITNTRLMPFKTLRDVAEGVDVIRRCIEVRKAQQVALDWDIVISRQAIKRIQLEDNVSSQGKAAQIARERFAPKMAELRKWWEKPDQFNSRTSTRGSRCSSRSTSCSTLSRSTRGHSATAPSARSRSSTAARSSRSSTTAARPRCRRTLPTSRSSGDSLEASSRATSTRCRLPRRPARLSAPQPAHVDRRTDPRTSSRPSPPPTST
jgi:hypothetical protein